MVENIDRLIQDMILAEPNGEARRDIVAQLEIAREMAQERGILWVPSSGERGRKSSTGLYVHPDFSYNPNEETVIKNGKTILLTGVEGNVLYALSRRPNWVFSRGQLREMVWGGDWVNERNVDVHVMNLRKKIEDDPRNPRFILTRTRLGYYLDDPSRMPNGSTVYSKANS